MTSYQHDTVVPFRNSTKGKKQQVAEMFDKIAHRYDFLNHFLSAGIDRGWRRKAIGELTVLHPQRLLDVATGTGDVAILMEKLLKPEKITGIDISEGMLQKGVEKVAKLGLQGRIELTKGDCETINFPDNTFDGVTVAFGVRNFEHLEQGLNEIHRVLRAGGKLVILEFSKPKLPLIKQFYKFYLKIVTPGIGKLISKDKNAYNYLSDSVQKFPEGDNFVNILKKLGYKNASCKSLSLGIASIYCGEK
jgi:demethylmenaquinone methyltransferase/2-methoxy-6-polyprenyl-1,4-benzoquinol methylase